ncbi:MAG: hypothetical protein RIC80_05870, partial [Cyclobacteriaceae bacterium]
MTNSLRLLILISTFIFITLDSYGQNFLIKGQVQDSIGQGISDVAVVIQGRGGTTTDEAGTFRITIRRKKQLKASFQHINHISQTVEILPEDQDSITLEIVLRSKIRVLEGVEVSETDRK